MDFSSHWEGRPRSGKWWALAPEIRRVSLGTFVDETESPPMTTAPEECLGEIAPESLVVVAVFVEGDELVSDVAGYIGSGLAADAF